MSILVVNAGSSSLKLRVLDDRDRIVAEADIDRWDGDDVGAIAELVERDGAIDAVGHRVVHGGTRFASPVLLDDDTRTALRALAPLAPLHQSRSLAGIAATDRLLPGIPAVACFDTAFHATLSPAAATYAVPLEWRLLGVRRYGFHGLSHAWGARRAAELLGRSPGDLRLVIAHLGAGASLCAVTGGRSVDTTMGFTPLEGLVMATRPGSVDPGVLLWLEREHGIGVGELEDGLQHRSGLLALSGRSGDLRDILAAIVAGDGDAQLAYAVYLHRLRASIAAMTATLGGLDALVFTGGVGQHLPQVRVDACQGLGYLGVALDPAASATDGDAHLSAAAASVAVLMVTAREDLQIAAEVRAVLGTR